MLVYFILGNHDDRRLMQETFGNTHSHIPTGGGFLNYAIEDHLLRLVSLDSLINRKVCGIVDEAQRGWLDATLSEPPGHADNRHAVSPRRSIRVLLGSMGLTFMKRKYWARSSSGMTKF